MLLQLLKGGFIMIEYLLEEVAMPRGLTLNLLISLAVALLLSLFIALIYRRTHRSMSYEPAFLSTIVLIAPIVALVMFFIRGDLVLSLGLIGSLSIIRFRTPIKDTRDMVYLFWVIVVGLGCGTENWLMTLLATVFMAIVASALYLLEFGSPKNTDFLLVVTGHNPSHPQETQDVVQRYTIGSRIRSHEVKEDFWEIVYELRFDKQQLSEIDQLINKVKSTGGVEKVSLLAPQMALPL